MASHIRDELLQGDHPDTHASASRWRHQESESFLRHAAPRDPTNTHGSSDLAAFLNSSRVDAPASSPSTPRHQPIAVARNGKHTRETEVVQDGSGALEVKCGPLLNYRRMEGGEWFGSVLVVTRGGGLHERPPPVLVVKTKRAGISLHAQSSGREEPYGTVNGVDYSSFQDPVASSSATNGASNGAEDVEGKKVTAVKLYSDPRFTFWRFDLQIPMQDHEIKCEYSIPGLTFAEGQKSDKQAFFVPAKGDSMRIMFHSCNGFSVGTDEEAWSGPCLWRDVNRVHKKTPFHVM